MQPQRQKKDSMERRQRSVNGRSSRLSIAERQIIELGEKGDRLEKSSERMRKRLDTITSRTRHVLKQQDATLAGSSRLAAEAHLNVRHAARQQRLRQLKKIDITEVRLDTLRRSLAAQLVSNRDLQVTINEARLKQLRLNNLFDRYKSELIELKASTSAMIERANEIDSDTFRAEERCDAVRSTSVAETEAFDLKVRELIEVVNKTVREAQLMEQQVHQSILKSRHEAKQAQSVNRGILSDEEEKHIRTRIANLSAELSRPDEDGDAHRARLNQMQEGLARIHYTCEAVNLGMSHNNVLKYVHRSMQSSSSWEALELTQAQLQRICETYMSREAELFTLHQETQALVEKSTKMQQDSVEEQKQAQIRETHAVARQLETRQYETAKQSELELARQRCEAGSLLLQANQKAMDRVCQACDAALTSTGARLHAETKSTTAGSSPSAVALSQTPNPVAASNILRALGLIEHRALDIISRFMVLREMKSDEEFMLSASNRPGGLHGSPLTPLRRHRKSARLAGPMRPKLGTPSQPRETDISALMNVSPLPTHPTIDGTTDLPMELERMRKLIYGK